MLPRGREIERGAAEECRGRAPRFVWGECFPARPRSPGSGGCELGGAGFAARGLEGDGGEAVGAVFGRGGCVGGLLALGAVVSLDDEEYHEGYDEEVDYVVEELPVGDDGDSFGLGVGERDGHALRGVERVEEAREVHPAEYQADGRHDDALDERRDDLPEGRADDDRDREVYDVAARDELSELFEHVCFSVRLQGVWCWKCGLVSMTQTCAS